MTIRLAIMSFAHLHAEAYVHNLRNNPNVELVGFADDDRERGEHFAQHFNLQLFDSYEALLREGLDGVLVCSENAHHKPLVEMSASAGVHVLSEKPLATNLADAQAMVAVCEKHNVKLMTAFPMRFNAPALETYNTLKSGQLGRIYGMNTTNQGEMPRHHRAWFVDKFLAGGGAVMDHTVHLADLLRWYLDSEVVEVYAETNSILYQDSGVDVETGGLIMLTFANGTFASIDCSWSKPPYYPTWGGLTMEIMGENGLVIMDAFDQNLQVYTHKNQRPVHGYWGSDSNQAMVDEFVACIIEDRAPSITGSDGYKALEVALTAYRSAESGQPIHL